MTTERNWSRPSPAKRWRAELLQLAAVLGVVRLLVTAISFALGGHPAEVGPEGGSDRGIYCETPACRYD